MKIEYEDGIIWKDDDPLSHGEACALLSELEKAVRVLDQAIHDWECDHVTTENPDGHNDDF